MSRENLQKSIVEIIWMARRYAVDAQIGNFNEAYDVIKSNFNNWKEKPDHIVPSYYVDAKVVTLDLNFCCSVEIIVTLARRYANGRMTFAPVTFNDEYDKIRDFFSEEWKEVVDTHIPTFPYAQDGHYGKLQGFDAIGNNRRYKI